MSAHDFTEAVAKGTRLLNLLDSHTFRADTPIEHDVTAASVQQSAFTLYSDLAKHGYVPEPTPEPFSLEPLRVCLQGLGVDSKLDSDGGKNVRVYHVHSQDAVIEGEHYPATHAYFSQLVNREQGVLIAHCNMTPPYMRIYSSVPTCPPLHYWSDVAFLQLLSCSSPSSSTTSSFLLKYIIRYSIQNSATISTIWSILSRYDIACLPTWPGISFGMDEEEGRALLGTPNGAGVGWLLTQRRRELGVKRVTRVGVFYAANASDLYRWPSLVFWVEEAGLVDEENEESKSSSSSVKDIGSRDTRSEG